MDVEKTLKVTLNEKEIEALQVCLDFCNINQIIRENLFFPKGYKDYEIRDAFNIYEKINNL